MSEFINLPPQQIPYKKKNKEWRKRHLDWADNKTFFNYSLVRKSVIHKKINYDLMNGRLHMSELEYILNPDKTKASYVSDSIQHYPIMNRKLNVLRGEELKRIFDYKVIITNPNAISEIENNKKELALNEIQQAIADSSINEDEFNKRIEKISNYYMYEWQDIREIRANAILKHYTKEYNLPLLFNSGFMDALIVGEEIYQCDIVGGEPVIERVNPLKIRVFKSGYSNKIEDADMIILEDYWSPGKVIDTYYDVLSKKDIEYLENLPDYMGQSQTDSMDNIDERFGYINSGMMGDEMTTENFFFNPFNMFSDTYTSSLLPYDVAGNVRVLRVYWKSKRRIKKVKSYNPETGEEEYNLYPEDYVINKAMGEEESIMYINEAWEGTKIGSDIYVNMRPRPVQYNRLSNPSKCHFGIIGSVYNTNDSRPYSLVDIMKVYNYYYDMIFDKLSKILNRNWGKIVRLDLSKVPSKWDIDKWLYYAKIYGIAVEDSFKAGEYGRATGVLAGSLNNATSGVIDAELGNSIQNYINILEYIKNEMSEVVGISRQREGQISNRETVGGVERATLQSSHITEWLFAQHDDVRRRALECFLETAKIAFRGDNKKFNYILPDMATKIIDIDGDEFAEADYGIVVDNSNGAQELSQKLDTLAQAALQNQLISFSTLMKLYNSSSMAEKQRLIEIDEKSIQERNAQLQQQQLESQQQLAQIETEQRYAELQQKEQANIRDNETKLIIAQMQANNNDTDNVTGREFSDEDRANLMEKTREFNERLKLDRDKLNHDKKKHNDEMSIKRQELKKQLNNNN